VKATTRGGAATTLPRFLGSDDQGFDVVDEPFVDATEPRVEPFVQLVGVAEQQLGGGGFVGFEVLERRPQCGAKRCLGVSELCAALGQRDRHVGAQSVFLGGNQRVEQRVLRVELLEDRGDRQSRLVGYVGDRRVLKTIARNDFLGRRHDLVTPLRFLPVVYHGSTSSSKDPAALIVSAALRPTTS
jgi:hypothetical protein